MDKLLIRKDVYEDILEKGYGKRDLSKLTTKIITDKNGHRRKVYVRNGEQTAENKQPKAQEGLTPEKKARYQEMLKEVMAGPNENALFVKGKGMLNKKDAIAHLSEKLGMKVSNQSADEFLHGSEPTPGKIMKTQQQKIMEENDNKVVIKRKYGMISLYGAKTGDHIADFPTEKARLDFMKENNLSKPDANTPSPDIKGGEKTIDRYKELYEGKQKPTQNDMKENYLDAKNEGGRDIVENNKIETLSEKIEFSPDEMKMIRDTAKEIGYRVGRDEGKLLNAINSKDKAMYSALTKKNQKVWDESGKNQKTFSQTDLLKEKIQSMNGDFGSDDSGSIFDEEIEEDTTVKTFKDAVKNYNFTDEKKNQFAMDEVAKFYPDLKETVDKRRKAFYDVDAAKKKLDVNPNNKEYQENFKNAANELSKMNKEYENKAAKALEKAPNIPKPSFEKYMDARRTVDKFKDTYKKQLEEYEIGQKFRNSNAAAILDPMYGLKPNDYTKDSGFINAQMTIRAYEGK